MKVTKNFSYKEFFISKTASSKGIDNLPSDSEKTAVDMNIATLAVMCLQPLRNAFPNYVVNITSGFRNEIVNKLVGGSVTSDHRFGRAADIKSSNGDLKTMFNWLRHNVEYDQLIWEYGDDKKPDWIHISYRRDEANRKQVLKAVKKNGKTTYIKI